MALSSAPSFSRPWRGPELCSSTWASPCHSWNKAPRSAVDAIQPSGSPADGPGPADGPADGAAKQHLSRGAGPGAEGGGDAGGGAGGGAAAAQLHHVHTVGIDSHMTTTAVFRVPWSEASGVSRGFEYPP